jgi:hypothetical protein
MKKTLKAAVVDVLKCMNDTNLQWSYVWDGKGDVELAGLCIPSITAPGSEILFKQCIHEGKLCLTHKYI